MNGFWKKGLMSLLVGMAMIAPLTQSNAARAADAAKAGIFGRVTLADSTPLAGVSLLLGDSDHVYARTDAEGRYTISGLPVQKYVVHPAFKGYKFTPETREVVLPTTGKPTSPNAEANFVAAKRADLVISGLIRTRDGGALPNVSVALTAEGFAKRTATTTTGGVFTFNELPYGKYTVTPTLAGYKFDPAQRNLTLPATSGDTIPNGTANFFADVVVPPVNARIFGRVTDASGEGVSGVKIFVGDNTVAAATTGADGKYVIPNLGKGRYVLTPSKSGYTFDPASKGVELPTKGKPTSPDGEANFRVKEVVTKTFNITGRVTNGQAPIPAVKIYIGDSTTSVATTNGEGRYTISKLPAGRYVLRAKKGDLVFVPSFIVVNLPTTGGTTSPSGEANFSLDVPKTYAIRGRISNNNVGVAGVSIFLGDGSVAVATTNSEGRYAIEGLAEGRYVVKATKDGSTFEPASKVVELPTTGATTSPDGEANFTEHVVVVPSTYAIRGRVSSSGVGVAGVSIFLGDGSVAVATTNSEGRYVIEGLAQGRYVVKAKKDGSTFEPVSKVVELPTTGATTSPDGEANFETKGTTVTKYVIRGKVANSSGFALAGVDIRIADVVKATTNSEGRYAIEGLEAGTYTVIPRKEGFTFVPISVTITLPTTSGGAMPNAELNFTSNEAAKTYSISGVVKTSEGGAVPGVTVTLSNGTATKTATTDNEGAYSFIGLVAATYSVVPSMTNASFTPETASITLPIKEGASAPNAVRDFVYKRK